MAFTKQSFVTAMMHHSEAMIDSFINKMMHPSKGRIDHPFRMMHWGVTPIDHFINKMMQPSIRRIDHLIYQVMHCGYTTIDRHHSPFTISDVT